MALLRSTARALSLLMLAISLAGCKDEVTELEGAVGEIPIFNPSRYLDRSSAYTSDVISDPTKFSSYSWKLETEKSAEEVIAFYLSQWPGASRDDDEEEGTVIIRNPPFPADENEPLGESLLVTVWTARQDGKTRFTIDEDVFRNRRP